MTRAARRCASALDEIVREGARRMLAAALEAEVDDYVAALADERDEHGRRLVVRNGHAEPRTITTGGGRDRGRGAAGQRQARRRRDRGAARGSGARSCRRGAASRPKVSEVLPLMYLHGMSLGRLRPGAGASSSAPPPGCRRR